MTTNSSKPALISKEPWPALGIGHYRSIGDGPWGYLEVYQGGQFRFNGAVRPSDEEIMSRWAIYFKREPSKESPQKRALERASKGSPEGEPKRGI